MGFLDFFTGDQPSLIKGAINDVQVMLNNGRDMFAAAAAHLLDNEILEVDLNLLDREINQREQTLRRAVLEHLNIDPRRELVLCLKLISIVQEAERIGDLAKMLGRTARLAHKPRMGPHVEPLRAIRRRVLQMFDQTRDGFVEGDASVAQHLMEEQPKIKAELTQYLRLLADDADVTPNEAVVYTLCARTMSRVSSHLANIASTVTFPFDQIRRGTV